MALLRVLPHQPRRRVGSTNLLGAESVLIGRDVIRAAVGGGVIGVKLQMEHLQKGLLKAMKMVGCKSLEQISKDILRKIILILMYSSYR